VTRPSWAPPEVDTTRASVARVYDYYLGGSHHFDVDRAMAEEAIRQWPELPRIMQANRAFLRRAVRFLVVEGITQFVDVGAGIPTVGNTHEVAQEATQDAQVVYIDNDPTAVAHSRAILGDDDRTAVVHADLRQPERIFADAAVRRLIDFTAPTAVLMLAVLHFVPDEDDPAAAVRRMCEPLPAGSYLVISHASTGDQPERAASHRRLYQRTANTMTMRSAAEIAALLGDFELVPPGVVPLSEWHPDAGTEADVPSAQMAGYAAVGRKH
jgi:hypothetical protein